MNEVIRSQQPSGSQQQRWIESAEAARDLKQQLAGLASDDQGEIQFIEWNPGRVMVTLWNMETGEEITLPRYQAVAALNTPNPNGGWMWTAHRENAPEAFVPSYPCFLHPDSPHRELLRSMGINATCMTMLADEDSAEKHALRHPSRWARLTRELQRREDEEAKEAQRKQTEAILALAGSRSEPTDLTCAECGFEAKTLAGKLAHERSHNKEAE